MDSFGDHDNWGKLNLVRNLLLHVQPVAGGCIIALRHSYATDEVHWYSFPRPLKDGRLSQPHLVLIQGTTGLKFRTLGSQASHSN